MREGFQRKGRQADSRRNSHLCALCEDPRRPLWLILSVALLVFAASQALAQTKPDKDYLVYVVSESAEKIALVRFGPNGARVDHQLETGDMPVDIDGPHGN